MAVLCLSGFIAAQDADSTAKPSLPVLTASADVYYRYDFAKTSANNRTSFTNSHNSFELGIASLKAEHSIGKAGMVADVGLGRRAEEFSYTDERTRLAIRQLNLFYSFGNGVKVTAGTWATHVGYELMDAYLNRNYSMSYLFSYGPFQHTGVKVEKSFGNTGIMLGIANPTDFKSTFDGGGKYFIAQLSTATGDGNLKLWLNYQGGKPVDSVRVKQFDLVTTVALSDKFSLGANATVAGFQFWEKEDEFGSTNSWWGTALYLNADPSDWLGLTLRTEYFSDKKGLNVFAGTADGGGVFAATFSLNLKAGNLTFIPELRVEKASETIFFDDSNGLTDTAASILAAAVYKF